MIRKIAYRGLWGRKKDTLILLLVVFLSVLFVVSSSIFYSSYEEAKFQERARIYGKWTHLYPAMDFETAELMSLEGDSDRISFLGLSYHLSLIGSYYNQHDLTFFELQEGEMPTKPFQIAIENETRSVFNEGVQVGDVVSTYISYYIGGLALEQHEDDYGNIIGHDFLPFKEQYDRLLQEAYDLNEGRLFGEEVDFDVFASYYLDRFDESPLLIYDHFKINRNNHKIVESEILGDQRLELHLEYMYYFIQTNSRETGDRSLRSFFSENGSLISSEIRIYSDYEVTGIMRDYNYLWPEDVSMPNTLVTNETYEFLNDLLFKTSLLDYDETINRDFSRHYELFYSPSGITPLDQEYIYNEGAYPQNEDLTAQYLAYGFIFFIFIATLVSILQLSLSQIKRRSRKLTLLKSVGMVNAQMAKLIFWEIMIIIAISLPLGILMGIIFPYGMMKILAIFRDIPFVFSVDYILLFLGVCFSVFAIILGTILPVKRALSTPLVGSMTPPPKRKKYVHDENQNHQVKNHQMTYKRIYLKSMIENRKRTKMTAFMFLGASFFLLLSVVGSFIAFKPYHTEVLIKNRPDVVFNFMSALSMRLEDDLVDQIYRTGYFKDLRVIKYGERAVVSHETWKEVERYNLTEDGDEDLDFIEEHAWGVSEVFYPLEYREDFIENAKILNLYSFSPESKSLKLLFDHIMPGWTADDMNRFHEGNQMIVLLPYHDGGDQWSYDVRRSGDLVADYPIAVGDQIDVMTRYLNIEFNSTYYYNDFEVFAVARGTGLEGIWPFSNGVSDPVLITSRDAFYQAYPGARSSRHFWFAHYVLAQGGNQLGRTMIYGYFDEGIDEMAMRTDLLRLSRMSDSHFAYSRLDFEHVVGRGFYNDGLRMAILVVMVTLSMTFVLLMIQYNIALTSVENQTERIGVLQALGVTNSHFVRMECLAGFGFAVVSLIFSQVFFGLGLMIYAFASSGEWLANIEYFFWFFPWRLYAIVQIVFVMVSVAIFAYPMFKQCKRKPIENINGNQR